MAQRVIWGVVVGMVGILSVWADGADLKDQEVIRQAAAVKPHPRQLAWQQLEFTGFVHFGVNTFTGAEWGTGTEDPQIFNPTQLDTDQWCRVAKAAGMKMLMLTAKHHDGFCLWQTRYTTQSVASSPWKSGKGDVLRELAESCKKHGLKLGVYLSPADNYQLENPNGYFGNRSPYSERIIPRAVPGHPFQDSRTFRYEVDDYNEYFLNQLFELLTEYGLVQEVFFDGARPKRRAGQQYAYTAWYDLIRNLAPDAVIAVRGPDVRWCGNEGGGTRASEWSVIPVPPDIDKQGWPDRTEEYLGSLAQLSKALANGDSLRWYPAENNTSICDGWFWRDSNQSVKSVESLLNIWNRVVGGNSVFLLNIPPDRRGLFSDRDCRVLEEFARVIRATFAQNLADKSTITASSTLAPAYAAKNCIDADPYSCWIPGEEDRQPQLTLQIPNKRKVNCLMLQEQIRDFGQRVAHFEVDVEMNGAWKPAAQNTVIGYKRLCFFDPVETDRIRIRFLDSRLSPTIGNLGVYYQPRLQDIRIPEKTQAAR